MARRWRWHGYAWAVAAAASCTLIGVAMQPRFDVVKCAAEISEAGDVEPGTTLPAPERASRQKLQASFDAARYDSLRILTTELKRVLKSGGEVKVRLSRSRLLQGERLERLLRVV